MLAQCPSSLTGAWWWALGHTATTITRLRSNPETRVLMVELVVAQQGVASLKFGKLAAVVLGSVVPGFA